MQILVATSNVGKQAEFQRFLSKDKVVLLFPQDIADNVDFPEETGLTFAENATLKAVALGTTTKLLTLADDSGLSVPALNNEPGVWSNRWLEGTDADRRQGLLRRLEKITDRSAYFTAVLCLYLPFSGETVMFEGVQHGSISMSEAGTEGFGYDSIFIPKGQTRTNAELGAAYKNMHSHRALALEKLRVFLKKNYAKLDAQTYDTA